MKKSIIKEDAIHKKRFKCKVHSQNKIDSYGDVSFFVDITANVDPDKFKGIMDQRKVKIGYERYYGFSNQILCRSDSEIVGSYFNWELEQDKKCAGLNNYTMNGYKAKNKPKIPDYLEGIVDDLHLNLCHRA